MGDTHHDPIDHFRTTHLHAGESMIDVYHWPGLFPVAVEVIALIAIPIRRIVDTSQRLPRCIQADFSSVPSWAAAALATTRSARAACPSAMRSGSPCHAVSAGDTRARPNENVSGHGV